MIRIGVAGWDYPDWRGVVYPLRPAPGFDLLHWISRFVDTVEINCTFYGPATPSRADAWCRRVRDREGFLFTAKSHRSWIHDLGFGWCVVDQPRVGSRVLGPTARVHGTIACLRLHGRNAANWFRPDAGRDARYDYLYEPREMEQLHRVATEMIPLAEELFVVQNNHFRGQALVNVLQWKARVQSVRPGLF